MDAKVTLSITSLSTHIEYAPLKYNDGEILIQKQSIFINHPDYNSCYKGRLSNNTQKNPVSRTGFLINQLGYQISDLTFCLSLGWLSSLKIG